MSMLIEIRQKIRRALEGPLYDALTAAGLGGDIAWPSLPFDPTQHTQYFDVEHIMGSVTIREVGPTPMWEGPGSLFVVVHTLPKMGQDENDRLQAIVAAAFPYAATVSFGGVDVFIDKVDPGPYGSDDAWLTGSLIVNWKVIRRG